MLLAFIDTETTGLNPNEHEILEIAILKYRGDCFLGQLYFKIKPEHLELAEAKALEINGYAANPAAWDEASPMSVIGPKVLSFIEGAVLVGHNVSFDREFLVRNLARSGVEGRVPHRVIDTITLAYEHLQPLGLKSMSLDAIREFLGWSKKGAHTALKDAEDARRLFKLVWRISFWGKLYLRARLLLKLGLG